jgi:2-keto-3-deoxy-L-rhamnonate aldolase RhmA
VLDQGASGIIVAMASSPKTMAAAIRRARYHPEGLRSYAGQRYGMRHEPADVATIRPAVYAMIETRQALDSVDAITAVPGIGGVHVGPVDLGLSLGLGTNRSKSEFERALRRIVAASHAASIPATMHAVVPAQIEHMIALGFDELVLTSDIGILRNAFALDLAAARSRIEAGTLNPTSKERNGSAGPKARKRALS